MSHISLNQVVYIVTGGSGGISSAFNPEEKPGDRTETFVEGSSSWTLEIARLPSDNRVFASGNFLHFDNTFSLNSLSCIGGTQVSTPFGGYNLRALATRAASPGDLLVPRAGSPGYIKVPRAGSPGDRNVPRVDSPEYK